MASLYSIRALLLLSCMLWHLQQQQAHSQDIPPISCPDHFQYIENDKKYIGVITIPNFPKGTADVEATFIQREPLQSKYFGKLSFFEKTETTLDNVLNGLPVKYRVDFPTPKVPPKITLISVNGEAICTDIGYPGPSTALNLKHSMDINLNTNVKSEQTPRQRRSTQKLEAQPPNANTECGRQSSSNSAPVINGITVVPRGQYPWLTAIYKKQTTGFKFLCGGSLVSSRTIITAAHCFKLLELTAADVVVFLGKHDLANHNEEGVQPREISRLIVHPEFNANLLPDADIAILHIQPLRRFTQFINVVCLWSETADITDRPAIVAGWELDVISTDISTLPKINNVSIVSDYVCLSSSIAFTPFLTNRTFCAGNSDFSFSHLTGSGLMILHNGKWVLRGIVSSGVIGKEYAVFSDLAKHIGWVQENL